MNISPLLLLQENETFNKHILTDNLSVAYEIAREITV